MEKQRNAGLDLLRFLAALFVTNSHLDVCYGNYSFMATGGSIGDVLFFFCSGCSLFMKPIGGTKDFPNWYKRRINRIFPSLFAVTMLSCIVDKNMSGGGIFLILSGSGYWFIQCIMLFYLMIYFIGRYFKWDYLIIYITGTLFTFVWFMLIDKPDGYTMYHPGSIIKWCPYFLFMVMGAQIGKNHFSETVGNRSVAYYLVLSISGIVLYYVFLGIGIKYEKFQVVQVLSFLPLLYGIYNCYLLSQNKSVERYIKRYNFIVRFIGGLCLEIYLIGDFFISDRLNSIFPLNIPIVFAEIIIGAYILRCFSRFFSQTFKDEPYDWKAMVKML